MTISRTVYSISLLIATAYSQRDSFYSFAGAANFTSSLVGSAYDYIASGAGIIDFCPLSTSIVQSLQVKLPYYVQSQELALEAIINAAASWEFKLRSGLPEPCVMAFTGPTGVGKSETAYRFAESVLSKRTQVGASRRYVPSGMLMLRGEDYSESAATEIVSNKDTVDSGGDNTHSLFHNSIAEMRDKIRSKIFTHLKKCNGNAVIIFEEVQKVIPGVLEVLIPMLNERGSVSDPKDTSGNNIEQSTTRCVFIFISDIADDKMIKLLMAHGDRSAIPHSVLRHEVKLALDQQWQRLNFGKVINEVVPFLPLEQVHLKEILIMKLKQLSDENKYMFWSHLIVDDDVVGYLVGKDFISYTKHTATSKINPSAPHQITNSSNSVLTKLFANTGARSLENAGPLEDMRSLLFRYMQPWRPRLMLHVGMADKHTSSSPFASLHSATHLQWTSIIKPDQIYLQWCDASVLDVQNVKADNSIGMCDSVSVGDVASCQQSINQKKELKAVVESLRTIDEKVAFSDACETIWYGYLQR